MGIVESPANIMEAEELLELHQERKVTIDDKLFVLLIHTYVHVIH